MALGEWRSSDWSWDAGALRAQALPEADPTKRSRRRRFDPLRCQVPGCGVELRLNYQKKYHACSVHAQAPCVQLDGVNQRFCQKCGRFHFLEEFDGDKRTCRAALELHNARRRKKGGAAAVTKPRKPGGGGSRRRGGGGSQPRDDSASGGSSGRGARPASSGSGGGAASGSPPLSSGLACSVRVATPLLLPQLVAAQTDSGDYTPPPGSCSPPGGGSSAPRLPAVQLLHQAADAAAALGPGHCSGGGAGQRQQQQEEEEEEAPWLPLHGAEAAAGDEGSWAGGGSTAAAGSPGAAQLPTPGMPEPPAAWQGLEQLESALMFVPATGLEEEPWLLPTTGGLAEQPLLAAPMLVPSSGSGLGAAAGRFSAGLPFCSLAPARSAVGVAEVEVEDAELLGEAGPVQQVAPGMPLAGLPLQPLQPQPQAWQHAAEYACPAAVHRLSLKIFHCTPDQLGPHLRQELHSVVGAGCRIMGSIRPGCTHLTLDIALTPQAAAAAAAVTAAAFLRALRTPAALGAAARSPVLLQWQGQVAWAAGGGAAPKAAAAPEPRLVVRPACLALPPPGQPWPLLELQLQAGAEPGGVPAGDIGRGAVVLCRQAGRHLAVEVWRGAAAGPAASAAAHEAGGYGDRNGSLAGSGSDSYSGSGSDIDSAATSTGAHSDDDVLGSSSGPQGGTGGGGAWVRPVGLRPGCCELEVQLPLRRGGGGGAWQRQPWPHGTVLLSAPAPLLVLRDRRAAGEVQLLVQCSGAAGAAQLDGLLRDIGLAAAYLEERRVLEQQEQQQQQEEEQQQREAGLREPEREEHHAGPLPPAAVAAASRAAAGFARRHGMPALLAMLEQAADVAGAAADAAAGAVVAAEEACASGSRSSDEASMKLALELAAEQLLDEASHSHSQEVEVADEVEGPKSPGDPEGGGGSSGGGGGAGSDSEEAPVPGPRTAALKAEAMLRELDALGAVAPAAAAAGAASAAHTALRPHVLARLCAGVAALWLGLLLARFLLGRI